MVRNIYIGNRGGLPIYSSIVPVVGTADVRFVLPNNAFRFLGAKGKIVIELSSAIPTGTTTTLPVLVEVNNQTLPLSNAGGTGLTVAEVTTDKYFEVLFDKTANSLIVTNYLG